MSVLRLANGTVLIDDTTGAITTTGVPVMPLSAVPHATVSSAITQTVVATNVAYPVLFELDDDLYNISRDGGTCSIATGTPGVVTCVNPATTVLVNEVPIQFTVLSDITKGVSLNTPYYITGLSGNTFRLSSTIALSRANTPDINITGDITGTFECISRLYFTKAGDYLIAISALIDTTGVTGATAQRMDLWFVQGNSSTDKIGTNLPKSNTQAAIDRAGMQVTVTVLLIIDVAVGDFVRLDYHGDDARLRWLAVAAGVTPTRPACPSILMTVNKIGS